VVFALGLFKRFVCVAAAFGLIVAVLTSPIRPTNPSRTNCFCGNFANPGPNSSRLAVDSATRTVYRVKALRCESEEELRSVLDRTVFSRPEPLPHFSPAHVLTTTIPEHSTRPLRC
jgi:hypothetical protein